jgi:hypothetical protein
MPKALLNHLDRFAMDRRRQLDKMLEHLRAGDIGEA